MESGRTFDDLLRHFDRPKTLDLPDFEWVDEVIPFDSEARANQFARPFDCAIEQFIEVPRDRRRGVWWVLAWAGAVAVLAIAAGVLIEFAYVLAAERTLSAAARVGAMEATLPRATYRSVTTAVVRRLKQYPSLAKQLHLSLLQNGTIVQSQFRQRDGDSFIVMVSGPSSAVVPRWLRSMLFWQRESAVQARAEQQLPGRKLAYGTGFTARKRAQTVAE
jgi:hypothetical protein